MSDQEYWDLVIAGRAILYGAHMIRVISGCVAMKFADPVGLVLIRIEDWQPQPWCDDEAVRRFGVPAAARRWYEHERKDR